MHTGWLCALTALLFFLGLACTRQWSYVCLCALVEGCWVALAYMFGLVTLEVNDGGVLFWALAGLVFSAVELCFCFYAFVCWADVRGGASGV